MESDIGLALGVMIAALLLSNVVSVYRQSLTRVAPRPNDEAPAQHEGLARGAMRAVTRAPLETAFTLLLTRLTLDAVGISAFTVYLLSLDMAAWGFVAALLAGLALALLLPLALSAAVRRYAARIALTGAPACVVLKVAAGPVAIPLYKLSQPLLGTSETLPEAATELAARFGRLVIPLGPGVSLPDEQEMGMIHAILQMEETPVRDVMVPRPDVVAIESTAPMTDALALVRTAGHSRILVYEGDIDHVRGILHARDLLRVQESRSAGGLMDLVRPAFFVPEGKRLDSLLREFQRQRAHMAVVVDEYGGTAGLVTLEDILEEIVGEIVDEFDQEDQEIQVISPDEVVMDARVNLSFLKEHFAVDLEGDGFDTVGGLVYNQLGKIPSQGDQAVAGGLQVEVLSTSGRRITRVRVLRR